MSNGEGYPDPTADRAIANVMKEHEREKEGKREVNHGKRRKIKKSNKNR